MTHFILNQGRTKGLLKHLNNMMLTIRFTVEEEKNSVLPFLDVQLRGKDDGNLDITVYRKSEHIDEHLHFQSHH